MIYHDYLSSDGARGFDEAVFGPALGETIVSRVMCKGNETRLENCSHPGFFASSCGLFQDASVDCLGRIPGKANNISLFYCQHIIVLLDCDDAYK